MEGPDYSEGSTIIFGNAAIRYDLIRKGVVVDKAWDQVTHGKSIQAIKDALTSKPVLMQVDNTKPFRLKVDASRVGRGIGGILEQQNADGKWQPVSYYSCERCRISHFIYLNKVKEN